MIELLLKAKNSGFSEFLVLLLIVFSWITAFILYKIIRDKNKLIDELRFAREEDLLTYVNMLDAHISNLYSLLVNKGDKQ